MAGKMVKLFSEKPSKHINQSNWPPELRRIISTLKNSRLCKPTGINAYERDNGIIVTADFFVDKGTALKSSPLGDIEPIAFIFEQSEFLTKAPKVFSNRKDFPRDFPHLNPVRKDWPASICLANFVLDELYRNFGMGIIAARLNAWLRDAANGDLAKDGWHPILPNPNTQIASIDLAAFQENALENAGENKRQYGQAITFNITENRRCHIICKPSGEKFIPPSKPSSCPTIFVQSPAECGKPIFGTVETATDIDGILKDSGISRKLCNPVDIFCAHLYDARLTRGIIIVGVWRPAPIPSATVGLSENVKARKLEVKAYEISTNTLSGDHLADLNRWKAQEIVFFAKPSLETMTKVSGETLPKKVCLIGYGALGSAIFDFLARSSLEEAIVFDSDQMESHNLARHTAESSDIANTKVAVARRVAERISAGTKVKAFYKKALFSDKKEAAPFFKDCGLVIDATADSLVRKHLSFDLGGLPSNASRVEIFDKGRLGVISISGRGNSPDFQYIYSALCAAALEDDAIAKWIQRDRERQMRLDAIDVGMTCSSSTVVLPKERILIHASAFMPKLREVAAGGSDAGFGINPLSPHGTPMGWRWFPVSAPKTYVPVGARDWTIRISPAACKNMRCETKKKKPDETGGYLYGVRNFDAKAIDVMFASPEPPNTIGKPTSLKLGKSGLTGIERKILEHCGPQIHLIGSWHSHPNGGVEMSLVDSAEMAKTRKKDEAEGIPTLMLICDGLKIGVCLEAD